MKTNIEGTVIEKITNDKEKKYNYSISTEYSVNQVLFWILDEEEIQYKNIPELSNNQKVRVEWNDENYSAFLIVSETEKIRLNRDLSKNELIDSQKIEKIETVKCNSCGSVVSINDSENIECEYCNNKVILNEKDFENIRTSIEIKKTNQKIFDELSNSFLKILKKSIFIIISLIPFVLFTLQIIIISWGTFFHKSTDFISDEIISEIFMEDQNFVLLIVLPSMIISILLVYISRKNAYSVDVSFLFSIFTSKIKDGNNFQCRSCGSPLKSEKIPEFVVCPYCKSENVVLSDISSMKNVSNSLNLSYLVDIKILHNEFKRKYNKYFIGVMIGIIVFYISFFGFTYYLEDIDEVHFLIKYIAMPFVVLILAHLLSEIALLPFFQFDDWMPKYFKNFTKQNEQKSGSKPSKILVIIPVLKIFLFVLFFVTLFFMK